MKKRIKVLAALLCIGAMVISGCGSSAATQTAEKEEAAAEEAVEEEVEEGVAHHVETEEPDDG